MKKTCTHCGREQEIDAKEDTIFCWSEEHPPCPLEVYKYTCIYCAHENEFTTLDKLEKAMLFVKTNKAK